MAHTGVRYPSVFVVDSHVSGPPIPPRLTRDKQQQQQQQQQQQHPRPAQTLLFLLVCLTLSGMVIEGCFIYRLYQTNMVESQTSSAKSVGDKRTAEEAIYNPPPKPVAHLTDGMDVHHKDNIMRWSEINTLSRLLYRLNYTDGCVLIQTEGYYTVYSQVTFRDTHDFSHSIQWKTDKYSGDKTIPLLQSRSYSGKSKKIQSNSFLSGVFHFYEGDAIFVQVSNTSQVVRDKAYENVFGVVML